MFIIWQSLIIILCNIDINRNNIMILESEDGISAWSNDDYQKYTDKAYLKNLEKRICNNQVKEQKHRLEPSALGCAKKVEELKKSPQNFLYQGKLTKLNLNKGQHAPQIIENIHRRINSNIEAELIQRKQRCARNQQNMKLKEIDLVSDGSNLSLGSLSKENKKRKKKNKFNYMEKDKFTIICLYNQKKKSFSMNKLKNNDIFVNLTNLRQKSNKVTIRPLVTDPSKISLDIIQAPISRTAPQQSFDPKQIMDFIKKEQKKKENVINEAKQMDKKWKSVVQKTKRKRKQFQELFKTQAQPIKLAIQAKMQRINQLPSSKTERSQQNISIPSKGAPFKLQYQFNDSGLFKDIHMKKMKKKVMFD